MGQGLINTLSIEKVSRFSEPLGARKDVRPFYLIGGASPDDPSNGTGGTGEGSSGAGSEGSGGSGDGSTGGTGTGGSGSSGSGEGSGKSDDDGKVSKAEFDALAERMKAADRNRSKAEEELKALRDKDLSEQEKTANRAKELESENTALKQELVTMKAKVAFLASSEHQWQNPDIALGQIDLSEVTDDKGDVDKKLLKAKMDALAKEHPFLVKAAGSDDGKGGGKPTGSSGAPVGSGGRGGALKKKYPALR